MSRTSAAAENLSESDGAAPARVICGFHQDDEGHWVAELACGHNQHVRHDPPWQRRPWTQTAAGRQGMMGQSLRCMKCLRAEPADRPGAWPDQA